MGTTNAGTTGFLRRTNHAQIFHSFGVHLSQTTNWAGLSLEQSLALRPEMLDLCHLEHGGAQDNRARQLQRG
jgi:hypothetical protein